MRTLRSTSTLAISALALIAATWTALHASRHSIYSDAVATEAASAAR